MLDSLPRSRAYLALARSLNAGLPLGAALDLASQGDHPFERCLSEARSRIASEGRSLAEALRQSAHGRRLPREELVLLAAAEDQGELPRALMRLSQRLEQRHRRTQRFLFSLTYPLLLLHAVVLAIHAPKVVSSPAAFTAAVLPTFLVMWTAGALVLLGIASVQRNHRVRQRVLDALRAVPVLASLLRLRAAADYAEIFGLGIATGLPLLEALRLGGQASSWSGLLADVERTILAVRSGASLAQAHHLHLAPRLPREILEAVRLGEETGTLDEALLRVASALDQRAEQLATRTAMVLPFLLYLLVALLVAVVVISAFAGFQQVLSGI